MQEVTIINESGLYSLILTSREIAELVGSTHDNVLKTVRRLISEGVVFGNDTPLPTNPLGLVHFGTPSLGEYLDNFLV